jgi:hypothetical protein
VQLYARDLIEGYVPLHLFEAPTIGSGKTLCAQAILYSALGRPVSPIVEAENDHEWRKRLSACFLNGRPVVFLDNLAQPLESPSLAAALTSSRWSDRLLGRNELIDVPVRCHWVATANNPVLSMEIARRTALAAQRISSFRSPIMGGSESSAAHLERMRFDPRVACGETPGSLRSQTNGFV